MTQTTTWLSHEFTVYEHNSHSQKWNNVAGIYIFAGINYLSRWIPYYIGQCDSFQDRIPSHGQWDKAQSLGATHVHAMAVPQAAMRDKIERELIRACQPRLNQQLKFGW